MKPLPIALLLALALGAPLPAQIPPGNLVLAMTSDAPAGTPGGLAVLDPATGQVQNVTWPLAVIIDFRDVLVEPGTGNLFVAGAASGALARSLEYWRLNGLAQAGSLPLHTFSDDIIGMCLGPGGDLFVLAGTSFGTTPPSLWRVDPRGIRAPARIESWSGSQGFPRAVCSDGTDLYVVCGSPAAIISLSLWRVPPTGGKSPIPSATRPPVGVPTDIDYQACGNKLWISLATGQTVLFPLSGASFHTHSNLGAGATAANHVPAAAVAYFAGLDPQAPQRTVVVIATGAGGTQRFPIPNAGAPFGLHSDTTWSGYHGSFLAYPSSYSCTGSSGRTPRLDQANGPPDLGNQSFALALHPTIPNQQALLLIGLSDQVWGPLTLPLDLALLGAPPGCLLLASGEVQLGTTITTVPTLLPAPIPCDIALLEAEAYLQFLALDPGVAQLPIIASNGAAVVLR